MDLIELKKEWESEEEFSFKGWDFSHISGRWKSEDLPWDYYTIVTPYLKATDTLLDMGTGGGEFVLSLDHPHGLTSITESYEPNVELCNRELAPLGITVKQVYKDDDLPFGDEVFDIVLNRHESFDIAEVNRILKKGGYFISQQIGGENDVDLSNRLIKNFKPEFPNHNLKNIIGSLNDYGFEILDSEESFTPIVFYDVGALVYFAKIIEWEFPGFSVESSFDQLCKFQNEIEELGYIQATEHRFFVVARKL